MKYFVFILLLTASVWCYKQYHSKDVEIRRLNNKIARLEYEIEQEPERHQQLWLDSCARAVTLTCFNADCAVTPIEVIQAKLCRLPEGI